VSRERSFDGEVLVAGAKGMLGTAFCRLFEEAGQAALAVDREELDISSAASVNRVLTDRYAAVINCAAYTNVDGAESDEEAATAVNGIGAGNLAHRCKELGILLIQIGTDYVFDGKATTPYKEEHPRSPINAYGRSKAEGERRIEASGARYLNVRTSWLYAPWANNFVLTMARLGLERDELRVVNDQRGRPTSSEHLARAVVELAGKGASGTYHVTDGGDCSWFDLSVHIMKTVRPDCRVLPCGSDEFPRPAPRPAYSVLDLAKTEKLLGPMPPWQMNVDAVLQARPR